MSTDEPADGVALCLSGGGYRAMLFHVGVVWRLHDAGWLKRLDRVSSVSGGSITAGALALAWPKLDAEGLEPTFVAPIRALAGPHRRRHQRDRRRAHARHDLRARRQGLPPPPVRRGHAAGPPRPPALRDQRDQRPVRRPVPLLQAVTWPTGASGASTSRPSRSPTPWPPPPPSRPSSPPSSSTCATSPGSTRRATTSATASTASARCCPTAASTTTSGWRRPGRRARPCSSPTPAAGWRRSPTPTTTGAATCSAC